MSAPRSRAIDPKSFPPALSEGISGLGRFDAVRIRQNIRRLLQSDRMELERRLAQARRVAREQNDPLTRERLTKLILDPEDQLR
jgi:hypothetical protein